MTPEPRLGLFGKIPAAPDFIRAGEAYGAFIEHWGDWLVEGLAQAREQLGAAWDEAWATGPIWRFRLSSTVAPDGAIGVLMPSADSVGRYFPLSVFAWGAPDGAEDQWFARMEAFALEALDEDLRLADILEAFGKLPLPDLRQLVSDDGTISVRNLDDGQMDLPVAGNIGAAGSIWWTVGGGGYPARAMACDELVPPQAVAGMLRIVPG